jgi:hypothetical protein
MVFGDLSDANTGNTAFPSDTWMTGSETGPNFSAIPMQGTFVPVHKSAKVLMNWSLLIFAQVTQVWISTCTALAMDLRFRRIHLQFKGTPQQA